MTTYFQNLLITDDMVFTPTQQSVPVNPQMPATFLEAQIHNECQPTVYRCVRSAIAVLLIVLKFAVSNSAAEIVVQVQAEGPHFANIPSTLRVLVQGFEEKPDPVMNPPAVSSGLQVKLVDIAPHVSQRIQIYNGRRIENRTVVYDFRWQLLTDKPGQYSVGPFHIQQGNTEVKHKAINLTFQEIAEDKDMRAVIKLPDKSVYPGERVPIQIEWWYAGDTDQIRDLAVRSPLFDQFDFIDEETQRGDQLLPIQTSQGITRIKAIVSQEHLEGQRWIVLSAKRELVADKPGEYTFPPTVATMDKVVRWRRDFFGDKIAAATIPIKSTGQPIQLVVRSFPRDGRPESFIGAVGSGFGMEVSADRTVVRVGDPIKLTIRVRGKGNLNNISLPPLDADGGMQRTQYRLPADESTGILHDGIKTFQVSIRVLDTLVDEIPRLAFSWFNPQTETYQTTHSAPIALRVEDANLVTAADVVSHTAKTSSKTEPHEVDKPLNSETTPSITGAATSIHDADLSIELNTHHLITEQHSQVNHALAQVACYLGGLAFLTFAVWDRQRRQIDPDIARRCKILREHQRQIQSANGMPREVAAKRIADSLRTIATEANTEQRSQIEPFIAQCEEIIYIPKDGNKELIQPELISDAASLVGKILQETT